jgi:hypothetical protein
MGTALALAGFWGHAAVGFLYAALAIWVFHQFGTRNRQQLSLIAALAPMLGLTDEQVDDLFRAADGL